MTKIPVVRCAPGVDPPLTPAGIRMLAAVDGACQAMGIDLTITSGRDSHMTGKHPEGLAWNLAAHGLTPSQLLRLRQLLMAKLGERFTVLIEAPARNGVDPMLVPYLYVNPDASGLHVHLQTKKGGGAYPPAENTNG